MLLSILTLPALAALPPHYQRQKELVAIISHVIEDFGINRPIESILMKDQDVYEVTSGRCRMEVVIVDASHEPGEDLMAGPRQFAIEAGPLTCD